MTGVHLKRTDENVGEIDALAVRLGGRIGLDGVLANLDRQARRSHLGRLLGRAVDEAYTWEARDNRDPRWWPQGISSSADAAEGGRIAGRRLLVVSWYSRKVDGVSHGSRVSVLDLDTLRYAHVLLVTPELEPVHVHAGGIVWLGDHLHVAATRQGLVSFRLDDVLRSERHGHRNVLPVRFAYRAHTDEGHEPLRYSFLSLDRSAGPSLVAGEYGRSGATTRLLRFDLDADGALQPTTLDDAGVGHMQGVAVAGGRHHVTVSRGQWRPGSVYVGEPGAFSERRWAVPMGPEDLAYWPSEDRLWSVTEHPRRRWIVSMRRAWFD